MNQESGMIFGSHGTKELHKKEVNTLSENSIPKDAIDEWLAPKQIHTFYMIIYHLYDNHKTKCQLDQTDREFKKLNQTRFRLTEKIITKNLSNIFFTLMFLYILLFFSCDTYEMSDLIYHTL